MNTEPLTALTGQLYGNDSKFVVISLWCMNLRNAASILRNATLFGAICREAWKISVLSFLIKDLFSKKVLFFLWS